MYSELKALCRRYQYISFDIFDTLIMRITEQPKDVFSLVQNSYLKRYGRESCIEFFPDLRVDSERIARIRKKTEITLDEIYDVINESANKEIVDRYKRLEIELELRICVQYAPIKEIFDYCLSSGKYVYITSDMYLPKEIIESILKRNGYSGYKKLFLSSVYKKTKAEGSLYKEIFVEERITPKELLHIGDNTKSDIHKAREQGIHTYQIKKKKDRYKHLLDKKVNGKTLYRFVEYTNPYDETFGNVGYGFFGPLLYGFITWLKEQVKTNKHDKLFFLSRDGFIMQKVYEMIRDSDAPKSYYFYASRRALQVAAIHFNPDYEYVMSHMFIPRTVSVRWLIKRWGLDIETVSGSIKDFSLDEEFHGEGIISNDRVRSIYNKYKKEIISNSENEFKAFSSYLEETEFAGNVAIVDIGWYGNMQNSIGEMLAHINKDINLTGYYLGIVPESEYQNQYNMHGFIFEKNKNEELYFQFKYISSMLELFFMAPHGSTKRYCLDNGKVIAELSQFEFEGTDTYCNMMNLQNAALEFVCEYHERKIEEFSALIYLSQIFERFTKPDVKTAVKFGNLQTWDEKWVTLATAYPVLKWSINPNEAVNQFLNAPWKMGYLKRNIKLPLPYDRIVYLLRKQYKK